MAVRYMYMISLPRFYMYRSRENVEETKLEQLFLKATSRCVESLLSTVRLPRLTISIRWEALTHAIRKPSARSESYRCAARRMPSGRACVGTVCIIMEDTGGYILTRQSLLCLICCARWLTVVRRERAPLGAAPRSAATIARASSQQRRWARCSTCGAPTAPLSTACQLVSAHSRSCRLPLLAVAAERVPPPRASGRSSCCGGCRRARSRLSSSSSCVSSCSTCRTIPGRARPPMTLTTTRCALDVPPLCLLALSDVLARLYRPQASWVVNDVTKLPEEVRTCTVCLEDVCCGNQVCAHMPRARHAESCPTAQGPSERVRALAPLGWPRMTSDGL